MGSAFGSRQSERVLLRRNQNSDAQRVGLIYGDFQRRVAYHPNPSRTHPLMQKTSHVRHFQVRLFLFGIGFEIQIINFEIAGSLTL